MSKKNNNNIQTRVATRQDTDKLGEKLGIELPEDHIRFLLANDPTLLDGRAFFYYKYYPAYITAHFIYCMFPLYRSEQEEPYQVPLKLQWFQSKGSEKQVVDYTAMLSSKAKGFCLSDWQPHFADRTGTYLPIAISVGGKSLICLGLDANNYGKVYIYAPKDCEDYVINDEYGYPQEFHQREIYGFSLLADSFADLVINLVTPNIALLAPQVSEVFNHNDSEIFQGTKRLQRLNELAYDIYKTGGDAIYQTILLHEQLKEDYKQKIEEVDTLTTTLDDYRLVISDLINRMELMESLKTNHKQQILLLEQELMDQAQQLEKIKASPLKKLQSLFNL